MIHLSAFHFFITFNTFTFYIKHRQNKQRHNECVRDLDWQSKIFWVTFNHFWNVHHFIGAEVKIGSSLKPNHNNKVKPSQAYPNLLYTKNVKFIKQCFYNNFLGNIPIDRLNRTKYYGQLKINSQTVSRGAAGLVELQSWTIHGPLNGCIDSKAITTQLWLDVLMGWFGAQFV